MRCEQCDRQAMSRCNLCAACAEDAINYDPDVDDRYEADEYDDCGLMPNGQCLRAGSEECDWECGRLRW